MANDEETPGSSKVLDEADVELKPLVAEAKCKVLRPYQRLITDKKAYNMSLWAMRLGVLADSVNTTILRPNYPFLVLPEGTPVSSFGDYTVL